MSKKKLVPEVSKLGQFYSILRLLAIKNSVYPYLHLFYYPLIVHSYFPVNVIPWNTLE
jgi:hypothetical protein